MTGLTQVLKQAAARLDTVSDTPRLDAELLLAHALGISRSEMLLRQRSLTEPDTFAALLARRLADEPVAYITGRQGFWDLELDVTRDVLIPRADSETLIQAAIEHFAHRQPPARIADLGTGSGALLLAALSAFPDAHGIGIDASEAALDVARGNAERLGFGARASFPRANWREHQWSGDFGQFDLILCNPPYVETGAALSPMVARYEPHTALFAGADGLEEYRVLLPQMPLLLAQGGIAIFEIGHRQAGAVEYLAGKAGLSSHLHCDLPGNPRALCFSLGIGAANG